MSTAEVHAAAMQLPAAEKAKLAEDLLRSLEGPEQEEIDAAWAAEAERRIDRLDRGEATAIPAEEVLRQLSNRRR